MADITRELVHLYPGAEWTCADGVVVFNDGRTPPTDEEIAAATVEIAAADAAIKYQVDRRLAYGDFGEQLDMQYHDLVDGTTTWKDHVAKVKSDNPKPG